MKIIRVVPFLDFGGVEQRMRLTVRGFQKIPGINLSIVVLGHGGKISDELEQKGTGLLILNCQVRIPNVKLIYRLYRIFKEQRPEVVHCSGSEANFHGLIAAKMARVQVKIGEEIGFPKHHIVWRVVFELVYTCADHVIGISKAVADRIVKLGEVPARKIKVVYNPVELSPASRNHNHSAKSGRFVFVTVCRLVPIKNLTTLLLSFQELELHVGQGRLSLNIVGEGPEKSDLILLCDQLNLTQSVKFLGFQEEVASFLQEADAFVLPSLSEGFSIALVEAMLCGLPSIVTKIGGPSEIIEDGRTGFLINPNSVTELTAAMSNVYLMRDSARKAMGYLAQQYAKSFSLTTYVKELIKIYNPQ